MEEQSPENPQEELASDGDDVVEGLTPTEEDQVTDET